MPCVLPVISLKIFGFIQHARDSRARIFGNGLAFTAGIFAWFIGLALLMIALKAAGHEITWAFQFTNPYFVIAMSAVVLVFALNLFGVFEITLPASATTGLVGWSAREGYAGSFFQGVFATVLATPCTAPYLGTALGFAFAQSAAIILLMFLAIAAGMSAPYLLLSAQPAWLRFVPRPGPWMVRVKQFMGFLLLATLLFLLWVIGVARGVDAAIWVSAFLLALSVGCWMLGSFSTPITSRTQRSVVLVLILLPRPRQRLLFHRSKIWRHENCGLQPGQGWLDFLQPRARPDRAGARPQRLRRFHRRLVHHLQIQRSLRSRKRSGEERVYALRHRENEGRLDERRPGHHKNFETIRTRRCPIIRALPGDGAQPTSHLAGTAHPGARPGSSSIRRAESRGHQINL